MTKLSRGGRKPGEPIYLRRHIIALALAVSLPVVLLQLYKIYIGPVSFDAEIEFGLFISILAGFILTRAYRSSAQNEP